MIKFKNIKEDNITISFDNSEELNKLVQYLKIYDYDYGTGGNTDITQISDWLGIRYFSENRFLSLDRSKKHHPRNYVSCGRGGTKIYVINLVKLIGILPTSK